jgi:hypothetical protein
LSLSLPFSILSNPLLPLHLHVSNSELFLQLLNPTFP